MLVMQDRFTKWVECSPLRRANTKTVLQAFKEKVIYRFGCPKTVICDNGPQFRSKCFQQALEDLGIVIRYTAPYSPQENPVERANRVIVPMIAQYVREDQKEWDVYLTQFMFAINTAKHETTSFTPASLNFGRELRPPKSLRREKERQDDPDVPKAEELIKELEKLADFYQITRVRLAEGFQRQCRPYNLRHRPYRPQKGQWAYYKKHHLSDATKAFSAKLAQKYEGPGKIIKIISPNIVLLQTAQSRRPERIHVKDLKPALDPPSNV